MLAYRTLEDLISLKIDLEHDTELRGEYEHLLDAELEYQQALTEVRHAFSGQMIRDNLN